MAEKSSTMQPSQMFLKPHRITKQITEIYIMKKQASKIRNRFSKLLNHFIQQQVIKIYAWKNKAKCIRPIAVLKLLTPAK
jgi:hypothetical protein